MLCSARCQCVVHHTPPRSATALHLRRAASPEADAARFGTSVWLWSHAAGGVIFFSDVDHSAGPTTYIGALLLIVGEAHETAPVFVDNVAKRT